MKNYLTKKSTYNYIAVIQKEHNSEYGVSFPDFMGCITAGKTVDEAKDLAQEALEFHIEGMLEDGEILPEATKLDDISTEDAAAYLIVSISLPKKQPVRINLSIDSGLLSAIDSAAENLGMTRSGFIAAVIRDELHL